MPEPTAHAARRRDARLAQRRKLSQCMVVGAAVASIGLGAAFARELPGHHGLAAGTHTGAAQPGSTQPGATQPGTAGSQSPAAAPAPSSGLSQPSQAPATSPAAPPQVTSGGS
jgi:hypothetical protein